MYVGVFFLFDYPELMARVTYFRARARRFRRVDVWTYGRLDVWTFRRMDVETYGCLDVWTFRRMDV